MSKSIIKVENLGKKYSIGEKQKFYTLRDSIAGIFTKKNKTEEEFWALKDVNFEVKQGESVGIIGRNGAGKSTLLKILSQITPPTTGKITMHGRVASLLEVGTGFHQELTGRENIYLNGAILGMTRAEIKRKFDEIVAFSEVEKFLDMPVKHYSSGMYMRLAFAVAAHLESEILIVDEVLAVGDAQFQKKCLGKMDEVAKKEGRTVLFVSHNMGAVSNLCSKGLLFDSGHLIKFGSMSIIADMYTKKVSLVKNHMTDKLHLESCDINNSVNGNLKVAIKFKVKEVINNFQLGIEIENSDGVVVSSSLNTDFISNTQLIPGEYIYNVNIDVNYLMTGNYSINVKSSIPNVEWLEDISGFNSFHYDNDEYVNSKLIQQRAGYIIPVSKWLLNPVKNEIK